MHGGFDSCEDFINFSLTVRAENYTIDNLLHHPENPNLFSDIVELWYSTTILKLFPIFLEQLIYIP